MTLVVETSLLIEKCRHELNRLCELAGDFQTANERSRNFLAAAFKIEKAGSAVVRPSGASSFKLDLKEWRERAEQTRVFAKFVLEPRAKRLLLEIAESYDRMGD